MKHRHVLSSICLMVAVMFILSVSVHPAMAAAAVNEQSNLYVPGTNEFGSVTTLADMSDMSVFKENGIRAVTLNELEPDGSDLMSASSAEDMLEYDQGIFSIRAKNPLTTHRQADFSAASLDGADDAEIVGVIANLSQAGYALTGQSDHRYQSTVSSEKFRYADRNQLAAQGITVSASDPANVTFVNAVTNYIFTNTSSNATRVLMAVQVVGATGIPVGDRRHSLQTLIPRWRQGRTRFLLPLREKSYYLVLLMPLVRGELLLEGSVQVSHTVGQ